MRMFHARPVPIAAPTMLGSNRPWQGREILSSLKGGVLTCGSKRAMDSHAEVRAMHRRNGLRWSAHFDLCCSLAPKDVQEEFARRTAESSRRFAWLNRHPLIGSGPLNLEPESVKPPTQVMAAAANISPQGSIHCRREATGPLSIGSAHVLVMNKELV